jgi:juvenile hormone epoxide hydrolase
MGVCIMDVLIEFLIMGFIDSVVAMHMNLCVSLHSKAHLRLLISSIFPSFFMDEDEVKKIHPIPRFLSDMIEETGYMHLQASKPDTVGKSL